MTTIISIVPEGTRVKKGDIICELDSSALKEQAKQQEIALTQAKAALKQAEENLEIQRAQNESDIAAAQLNLDLARLDLEKYLHGEYIQQRKEIEGEIKLAEEELARAREFYEFSKRIARKGYRSQNDLEADRIAVTKAEIALRVAQEKLNVLENYTKKRTIAELEANAAELVRELERVKRKASAALAQFEAEFEARKLTAEVEQAKYDRLLRQIEACTLRAPQDGEVVYANEAARRRGSSEVLIEEGAAVRERQAIIKLPDVTAMKVDCRVHESRIGLVRTGLPVTVRVDAYPNEIFHGVVDSVSSVPMSGRWPNLDLKEYETVVRITDPPEVVSKLRPGLTANLEILVEERSDVLQAPVQAVVEVGRKHVAYVLTPDGPERRDVLVGVSNDAMVEIRDGLAEGDEVILNPRTHFADELADLADQYGAKKSAAPDEGESDSVKKKADGKARPKGSAKTPRNSPAAMFKRLDTNGDGQISVDEVPAFLRSGFDKLDTDGNGSLSRTEFMTGLAKLRGSGGAQGPPGGPAP